MKIGEYLYAQSLAIQARDFSKSRRKKLAKSGAAEPDGSFPIVNKEDLKNAEHMVGLSKNPAKARAHIAQRKKALGITGEGKQLPSLYVQDKKRYKAGVKALSKEIKKRKMKMGGDLGESPATDL